MIRWYLAPLETHAILRDGVPIEVWHARTFRYAKPPARCGNVPMRRGPQAGWWALSRVDADAEVHAAIDADATILRLGFRDAEGRDLPLSRTVSQVDRASLTKLRADLTERGIPADALTPGQTLRDVIREVIAVALGEAAPTDRTRIAPWLSRY